ncbi:MAG TPA: carboxypeptidase regulatory-like domain-containing protein [Burkholderiales bacterium]|nr:carboxypeptidase regulatory-like domain-containing protein [Burkholderiales bacterium]
MTSRLIVAGILTAMYAAPVQAYEVAAVANGGKIEGKVTYNGAVPIKKIIPTKDKEVCGGPRDEPQILVGDDKSVEDAIVYLKDVAKGKEWGKPDKNPLLDQEKCKFRPTVQVIRPGPLDITSSDPVLHNPHGFYGKRTAFNLGLSNKGDKVTRELEKPGMVRVECDAHGWMLAWIYVADSPYYALTKKDGSFSIADVPPGDYTVVATQAHAGDTEAKVTVKSGETAKANIELKKK